jgi:hypothetical protein
MSFYGWRPCCWACAVVVRSDKWPLLLNPTASHAYRRHYWASGPRFESLGFTSLPFSIGSEIDFSRVPLKI